jgi:hypothetical protein
LRIGSSNQLKALNIYTGGEFALSDFAAQSASAMITPLMALNNAGDTDNLVSILHSGTLLNMDFQNRVIDFTTDPVAAGAQNGVVFFARTKDYHYAKVVVLKKNNT